MSIFEHHRFEIWNQTQHPYKHEMTDFSYTSNALPGVSTVSGVLDWIVNVLYPTPKDMVATPAALPSVGNSIGDYRVVTDDGDGKSAGYRWEQREGDAAAKWYKIYDMDFGAGSVLQQAMSNAQELFVIKLGNNDLDATGVAVAGTYAGQTIFGGTSASTNLTLEANSGDGVGSQTGFVQVDDHFRPATDAVWDMGTSTKRFRVIYGGTMALSSSGGIDQSYLLSIGDGANPLTGTTQNGIFVHIGANSAATTACIAFNAVNSTAAAAFTCAKVAGFNYENQGKGAGSTITRAIAYTGIMPDQGTNNAFISDNAAFTGNYFIHSTSTNDSIFSGAMGIAGATLSGANLAVGISNVQTATTQIDFQSRISGSSGATTEIDGFVATPTTAAAAFTNALLVGFRYSPRSKGAGSTITRTVGFYASSASSQGTNNCVLSDNAAFTGDFFINQSGTTASIFGGDLKINTAGKGLFVKEGSNAKMGTATLNGTTAVTISTTAATTTSRIFLTTQASGGTVGAPYVDARSTGVSFNIKSTNASDTSTVAWMIVDPA